MLNYQCGHRLKPYFRNPQLPVFKVELAALYWLIVICNDENMFIYILIITQ